MNIIKGLLLPVFLLFWWWVASTWQWVNNYLLPSPADIWSTAVTLAGNGILWRHVEISLYRVLTGFGFSFALAFLLAVILGLNRRLNNFFEPLLNFIRHVPPIACIPLLILWLGIDEASKLAVIVLAAFFPVFLNSREGFIRCDPKLLEVGQAFGLTRQQQFFKIILPSALPSVILGIRLGLGYSWRALIGAELVAASAGLGYMIIEAEQLSRPDIVIVGIAVIGMLGYAVDYVLLLLSLWLLPWEGKDDYERFDTKTVM